MNKNWMPVHYRNILTVIANKVKQQFQLLTQNIYSNETVKNRQIKLRGKVDKKNEQDQNEHNKLVIKQFPKAKKNDEQSIMFRKQRQKLEDLIRRKQNLQLNLATIKKRQQKLKSLRYEQNSNLQVNPQAYQSKIKQLAQNIRKKVKRRSLNIETLNHSLIVNKNVIPNHREIFTDKKISFSPKISNIFNTQVLQNESRQTFNQGSQKKTEQSVQKFCQRILFGLVNKSVKQGQQKLRHSFKFDTVKHKYPTTVFRKRILKEGYLKVRQQQKKEHQKQVILKKRKQLWDQSRKRCHKSHIEYIQAKNVF